jgi:hypothetical protein
VLCIRCEINLKFLWSKGVLVKKHWKKTKAFAEIWHHKKEDGVRVFNSLPIALAISKLST